MAHQADRPTQAHKESDPSHPSQPNSNHTNSSGDKPTTAIDAILDPEFLPTLDEAPKRQQVKSHVLLLLMVAGAIFLAWLTGFEILQIEESWGTLLSVGGGAVAAMMVLLWWSGALWLDVSFMDGDADMDDGGGFSGVSTNSLIVVCACCWVLVVEFTSWCCGWAGLGYDAGTGYGIG